MIAGGTVEFYNASSGTFQVVARALGASDTLWSRPSRLSESTDRVMGTPEQPEQRVSRIASFHDNVGYAAEVGSFGDSVLYDQLILPIPATPGHRQGRRRTGEGGTASVRCRQDRQAGFVRARGHDVWP